MIELIIMGGLGNQMFEYAFARSKQLDRGDELCINTCLYDNDKFGRQYSLDNLNISNNIKKVKKVRPIIYLARLMWKINGELAYKLMTKIGVCIWEDSKYININLDKKYNYINGYFQSEKYFIKYSETIKKELRCKNTTDKNIYLKELIENTEAVCVHVRRGDYVSYGGIVCDIDYYYNAMTYMRDHLINPHFFCFSDDINWVKENVKANDITYVDNNNKDYEELELMYCCKHFIISNSSFSWWAQYLSIQENKIVVAPSKWWPRDVEKSDIYLDNFICM